MKGLVALTITLVIGTMFASLFLLVSGTSFASGMSDCPFMAHEEVVCPMDVADHLSAWKAIYTATTSSLLVLVVTMVSMMVRIPRTVRLSWWYVMISGQLRERTYHFSSRPYQELFAGGILHPKVY